MVKLFQISFNIDCSLMSMNKKVCFDDEDMTDIEIAMIWKRT